ncbi:MAG: hypothetical protein ACKOXP_05065 [Flavobacteriales bacterium]
MNPIKQDKSSLSILLTSSFYALCLTGICLFLFYFPVDFSIPKDKLPLIGEASKHNVLVATRVRLFYQLIFTGSCLWLLFIWLFQKVYDSFVKNDQQYTKSLYFAVPIIPYLFLAITGAEVQAVIFLLFSLFILSLFFGVLKDQSFFNKKENAFPFSLEASLGIVFIFHLMAHFFFAHVRWMQQNSVFIILVLVLIVMMLGYFFRSLLKDQIKRFLLLLFAGFPFLMFISIEWQVLSLEKGWNSIGYQKIFALLLIVWLIFSWIWSKWKETSSVVIAKKIVVPSLIFGYTLLVFYQPVIQPISEFFELANPANSLLRIFQFGEIPVLDFMSSHMFSEQWYGMLYQTVFGVSNQVEFTIYSFLNEFVFLLILYWILIKLGFPLKSVVIFIFFFPILDDVFFWPVMNVFFVLFMTIRIAEKPTRKNVFYFFLLLFLLVLWRIDTGVSAILSTVLFVPLYFWFSKSHLSIRSFFSGLATFFGFLLAIFLLVLALRSWNHIWGNFQAAWHYINGSQAHGAARIFNDSHQFYVFHILFVVASIVLIFFSSYSLRQKSKVDFFHQNKWLIFSIFSFLVFITNAQRGLVRHGFNEHTELFFISTWYLGLAFFVTHFVQKKRVHFQFTVFFSVLFFAFISTKFFTFLPTELNASKWVHPTAFTHLDSKLTEEHYHGRIIDRATFDATHFTELKTYLNANLAANETFLDFSNTPMLYYYCQRKVPGYFNQNLQNTIDLFLQEQFLSSISKKEVPIVVLSSFPRSWYDETDGVDNTIRYDRIADFIFKNYDPIGVLNKYSIFGLKNRKWTNIPLKDTFITKSSPADIGYLAAWEGNYFHHQKSPKNKVLVQGKKFKSNQRSTVQSMKVNEQLIGSSGISLVLKAHPESKNYLNETVSNIVFKDSTGNVLYQIQFSRDDKQFDLYAIRLSNHYFWHHNQSIIIEFPQMLGIEKVRLYKDQ